MPEPVLYLRGVQLQGITGLGKWPSKEATINDLRAICGLDDRLINQLVVRFREMPGFLGPRELVEEAAKLGINDATALAIRRALSNIEPDKVGDAINTIESDDDEPVVDGPTIERFREVLPRLIRDYPAINRHKKAAVIAMSVGKALEGVSFVCDLRPVFNEERTEITGMIPITTLSVTATGADGLPVRLEAYLSRAQVEEVLSKAEMAKHKLEIIRRNIEEWRPGALPDLPVVQDGGRE